MSEEIVLYEELGGVAKITINRPSKYNALNTSVVSKLTELMKKAEDNESIRVVILSGASEKAFAAGADILVAGTSSIFREGTLKENFNIS